MIAMPRKSQKKVGRARDIGETEMLTVEIPVALAAALEKMRQADRRTKRAIIEIALERILKEAGYWPPAD